MKKIIAGALCVVMATAMFAGCNKTDTASSKSSGEKVINLYTFTKEVVQMSEKFKELHPDFEYTFNCVSVDSSNGLYTTALDQALQVGGEDAPDIYCAEASFVLKYTQGAASQYACGYEDIGLDVAKKTKDAGIAQYVIDIGTRPSDGKVVGLGYQSTGGAMIYRTDIAKEVFGTDDPKEISSIVGGGTGKWDKFWEAAETLKEHGYAIVSGDGDIWHSVENSASYGWLKDGKLSICPEREAFIDMSMRLKENDYYNGTSDMGEEWNADVSGTGEKGVFAFFGPAWLINYTMGSHAKDNGGDTFGDWHVTTAPVGFFWGGTWVIPSKYAAEASDEKKAAIAQFIEWITLDYTETGLQYLWANGKMNENGTKDCVASSVVMSKSDGTMDFLGGQNMFDYFVPANANASGATLTEYDSEINQIWREQVGLYTDGEKSKEDAIKDFKELVKAKTNIDS